jgi:hypothetical protein
VLRDRDGGLWIGTSDRGLVHLHQGRADVFARSEGLSGDFISSLFEDREGNVWVSTQDGLDRFREVAVPTSSVSQGLSSARIGSVLAAQDGSVWLATSDGLNRWNNGRLRRIAGATPVALTRGSAMPAREIADSGVPNRDLASLFRTGAGESGSPRCRIRLPENDRFVSRASFRADLCIPWRRNRRGIYGSSTLVSDSSACRRATKFSISCGPGCEARTPPVPQPRIRRACGWDSRSAAC